MNIPRVLIVSDSKQIGIHAFHCVGEKYIEAMVNGVRAWPIMVPAMAAGTDLKQPGDEFTADGWLDLCDGLFLPGSPSNIEPKHYLRAQDGGAKNGGARDAQMKTDPQRDSIAFELIRAAAKRKIPILGVCRGFQELNVAFGGSLHANVHDVPGYDDHREDESQPRAQQYGPAHSVALTEDGELHKLIGHTNIEVNSLHAQGVDQLAPNMQVEAVAPDGLIEGFSLPGQFCLAVQWHPEWLHSENPVSTAIFQAFGQAMRAYVASR